MLPQTSPKTQPDNALPSSVGDPLREETEKLSQSLIVAVRAHQISHVKNLLAARIRPDTPSLDWALWIAVQECCTKRPGKEDALKESVLALLEVKANPNITPETSSHPQKERQLFLAATHEDMPLHRTRNRRATPLHLLARTTFYSEHALLIHTLMQHGAAVDLLNEEGKTPLQVADFSCNIQFIQCVRSQLSDQFSILLTFERSSRKPSLPEAIWRHIWTFLRKEKEYIKAHKYFLYSWPKQHVFIKIKLALLQSTKIKGGSKEDTDISREAERLAPLHYLDGSNYNLALVTAIFQWRRKDDEISPRQYITVVPELGYHPHHKKEFEFPITASFNDPTFPVVLTFTDKEKAHAALVSLQSPLVYFNEAQLYFTPAACQTGVFKKFLEKFNTSQNEKTDRAASYLAHRSKNTNARYYRGFFGHCFFSCLNSSSVDRVTRCQAAWDIIASSPPLRAQNSRVLREDIRHFKKI